MCAHFKIKDPQSLLNAAAESSVTDGCAADDLSWCSFVSCAELALDPANFCLISARVELKRGCFTEFCNKGGDYCDPLMNKSQRTQRKNTWDSCSYVQLTFIELIENTVVQIIYKN